jgi:hypothetical protein
MAQPFWETHKYRSPHMTGGGKSVAASLASCLVGTYQLDHMSLMSGLRPLRVRHRSRYAVHQYIALLEYHCIPCRHNGAMSRGSMLAYLSDEQYTLTALFIGFRVRILRIITTFPS